MPAISARKFFAETVSITEAVAISLADVLKAAGWGFTPGADNAIGTELSMDSFIGDQCFITPAADMFIGHDQYVRATAGAGPPRTYQGVLVGATDTTNVVQPQRGVVDAHAIWFYSATTQNVAIVFAGV